MTTTQLLLAVILTQQGLFALVWAAAAWLGLARRASRHWALAAFLAAFGMSLILLRGPSVPAWVSVALANALLFLSFAAARRGLQVFARLRPTDLEQGLLVLVAAAGLFALTRPGLDLLWVVVLTSIVLAWTLLRTAFEIVQPLGRELGVAAARACAAPIGLIGMFFALRGLMAPLLMTAPALDPSHVSLNNAMVAFAAMIFGLVINIALASLTMLRLVRRLQFQSDHDSLTRLLNRRAMERLLDAESRRQHRYGSRYAVLSIDIDLFKSINDRYGHAAGDAVLVQLAQVLRTAGRDLDRVARVGGEEFCMLLPGVDRSGAEAAAKRLLSLVRDLRYPGLDPDLRVTISIGVAAAGPEPQALPALLQRLDQALYAAKDAGRDRYCQAD